jgi:hypothetical protein
LFRRGLLHFELLELGIRHHLQRAERAHAVTAIKNV